MRRCEDCLVEKSEGDFYHHVRTGPAPICKPCTITANRIRRQDPEAYKALVAERRRRRRVVLVPGHKICPHCSVDKPLTDFREKARGLYGRSSWCRGCEGAEHRAYTNGPRREELLQRRREQWAATPRTEEQKQEAAARARDWYAENKDRHQANNRRWILENRDAFRIIQARYHHGSPAHIRRRGYFSQVEKTLTESEWLEILECFDHRCAYCLKHHKLTMDHLIPVSKGGPHAEYNVVPACRSCNSKKSSRPLWVMLNM